MKEASLQVLLPVIPVILQTTKHQKKNTRSMEAYRSGGKQTMSEAIVITSGKGGVGKTTTVANIGTGLAMLGRKVVVQSGCCPWT